MAHRMVKACLIANPKSGRGGVDLSEAVTVLREHGWDVLVRQKLHGGHATQLARQALDEGCNVVVDCGGDGTLNEIVEGVVGSDVAVGVLPGGTANLWAHEATISPQLGEAARQLVGADRRTVDVGRVTINGRHKSHFLLMAGLGFDGAVLAHLSKPLKNRIGAAAYAPAVARAMRSFHPTPLYANLDGIEWRGAISQIVVGNTRRYAGFTRTTPSAFIDDGLLDTCLITCTRPLSILRQMATLALRQHPSPASAHIYRAAEVTIHSPLVLPLEVDGGLVHLDEDDRTADGVVYNFTVTAQGVTLLTPQTYGGALFQPARRADALTELPHRAVRPPVQQEAIAANGHSVTNGHGDHLPKEKRWRLQVLDAGVDSVTAARRKNGRTVRVIIAPSTTLVDEAGIEHALWGELSKLSAGDCVRATGIKDARQGAFVASRIVVDSDPAGRLRTPVRHAHGKGSR